MLEPGVYKTRIGASDRSQTVEVLEATNSIVTVRSQSGETLSMSLDHAAKFIWTPLDESQAYGNDCRNGRCEG